MSKPVLQCVPGKIQYRRVENQNFCSGSQEIKSSPAVVMDISRIKNMFDRLNNNASTLHQLLKKQPPPMKIVQRQISRVLQLNSKAYTQESARSTTSSTKPSNELFFQSEIKINNSQNNKHDTTKTVMKRQNSPTQAIKLKLIDVFHLLKHQIKIKCQGLRAYNGKIRKEMITEIVCQKKQMDIDIQQFKYNILGKIGANQIQQSQLTADLTCVFEVTQRQLLKELAIMSYKAELINITNEEAIEKELELQRKLQDCLQEKLEEKRRLK